MKKARQRKNRKKLNFEFEKLETKRCLASVGWDGTGQGGVELSYYLGAAPSHVSQATFESVVEQALEVWSDVADITFTETTTPQQADSLDITFASLDGSGGVLAQAYFPDDVNRSGIAGDIQFDTSENWEVGNQLGSQAFDLLYVAVHEIGHALGLEHSNAFGSVLNGSVSPNQQFTSLGNTDQSAVLALYAPATVTTPLDPVGPTIPNEGVETPLIDPVEAPVEQPTVDPDSNDPAERDSNHRHRWGGFRIGGFNRFRFFNFFQNPFGTQSDAPDTGQVDHFSHRFTIRIFRFFR